MADKQQLTILKDVKAWNTWPCKHKGVAPDLREVDLAGANLRRADLRVPELIGPANG
jgi:hypothetical protein